MVRKTYKVHDIVIPQANDPTKTVSKTVYESETHHAEDGMIGFEAPDATLVSNVLTPVDSVVVVRGEGASADIIDHISFSAVPDIADKDLLWLIKGAEAITINHNTGSPPANAGPVLLLSQVNKKMIGTRMILLQRQGSNFQEITFDGIVGNGGVLVEDDNGNAIIICGSVASAVNHLKVTNAITNTDVIIEPAGTDTNIGLTIQGKGTKFVKILSLITTQLLDANSLAWAKVTSIASAVNEFTFSNAATGNDPILEATGTDTDVGIEIKPKGTGIIKALNQTVTNIREATGNALAIVITAIASAVNHIEVKANITANDPEIQAKGSDTDVGIKFVPKGAGVIYGVRESWGYPLTDEDTAPTTGVKFVTEPAPYDMTIDDVITGLKVAGTGAALFTIDILKETSVNGNVFASIFTTDLVEIDASEFTSTTAATQPNITTTTWEKGRRIQLSISILDTNGLARGAKVVIVTHATAK